MFFNMTNGFVKEVFFSLIALITYLLVGINRSFLAFFFHQIDSPDSAIVLDTVQKSWLASSISMLSPVGCLFSGIFMDIFGRKLFIQMTFVPFIVSWICITMAKNPTMLYIGIAIQGISGGMSFCVASYIAEISTAAHRGALLSTLEITYSLGILVCNELMYYLQWNVVALLFVCTSVTGLALTILLPESPAWLQLKNEEQKAADTLCALRCATRDQVEKELREIEKYTSTLKHEIFSVESAKMCLRVRKLFFVVTSMFILFQSTGYPVMMAFTVTILNEMRIPFDSSQITVFYSLSLLVGSFCTPYFIHRFKRKTILAISGLGMGCCMLTMAVYEELFYDSEEKPFVWIVPVAFCAYSFACVIGVLPLGFMMGGELFPLEVRGILNGLYGSIGYMYWAAMFKVYPYYLQEFGVKVTLWTFAGVCLVTVVYGMLVLPETKGKSLGQVQRESLKRPINKELYP